MGRTRDKLSEAQFFLQQLEQHVFSHPVFNYYLSAFISSARSVLWVMRNEYHDISGWEQWYSSKVPTADEDILLRSINDVRVRSEKKEALHTRYQVSFHVAKEDLTDELRKFFEENAGKTVRVTIEEVATRKHATQVDTNIARFFGGFEAMYRVIDEFPDEDVVLICRRYYSLLEQVVIECEAKFQAQ